MRIPPLNLTEKEARALLRSEAGRPGMWSESDKDGLRRAQVKLSNVLEKAKAHA